MSALELLAGIVDRAPADPDGEKWALFSPGCCWWTSNPALAARTAVGERCCPNCHAAPLFELPLQRFIALAITQEKAYQPLGLQVLVAAHSAPCQQKWAQYAPVLRGMS